MAYTRWNESGHYIYGGIDYVDFDGKAIPYDAIDVFIYKLFGDVNDGDSEFWERYQRGSRIVDNFQKGYCVQKICKHAPHNLKPHVDAISSLAGEIWREHFVPIVGTEQVEYMLDKFQSSEQIFLDIKKNELIYFIAKTSKDDKLIGYGAVVPHDDYLLLSKAHVHNNYRGLGISRSFMKEAMTLCEYEYDLKKIRLMVNKANDSAIAVYDRMGFTIIESVKTDIGGGFFMDDYVMEMILAPTERLLPAGQNNHREDG